MYIYIYIISVHTRWIGTYTCPTHSQHGTLGLARDDRHLQAPPGRLAMDISMATVSL